MDRPAPPFLLPFLAKFLSLYVLSGSYESPGWLLETSFFSRRWHNSSSCSFSLAQRSVFWGISCLPELTLTAPFKITHKDLTTSGARCEFRAWGIRGVHVSGWGILGWGSPSGYGQASCWSPEISQQVFHPFNAIWYFYLFPDLPSPAHWRSHLNTLGAAGEKWASPAVFHTAGAASSHSLLSLPPIQVSATYFRFALCCLREGAALARFLLPSPLYPNSCFVFPTER